MDLGLLGRSGERPRSTYGSIPDRRAVAHSGKVKKRLSKCCEESQAGRRQARSSLADHRR